MWPARILCAIDFSPGAREAARVALALAATSGGEVTLFHSFDLPLAAAGEAAMTGAATLEGLERETDAGLRAWREELGGDRIQIAHGLGGAAETIARHAGDHRFDVIVIGTHGRTGLKRVLLGSVAEQVVRHAPCPVLVVRSTERT
jgi:nucleotide-binding universal stress UspA family protein